MDAKEIAESIVAEYIHVREIGTRVHIYRENNYKVAQAYLDLLAKLDEPTEEMILAGCKISGCYDSRSGAIMAEEFKAMIAELKRN